MVSFSSARQPSVSIIVTGWKDARSLGDCLTTLSQNVPETIPHEVIVVLNEPTDALLASLRASVSGIRLLHFRSNLGFGGAINCAAAIARGRAFALLNDDCFVEPRWLEELLATIDERPRCGVVGSRFLHPDGSLQEAGCVIWPDGTTTGVCQTREAPFAQFAHRVDYCSGASLLVRAETWNQLGGLSEDYYPAYYEDVDFCLRAASLGWEVWYQSASRVSHARSTSTSPTLKTFLLERAREVFTTRWAEWLAARAPVRQIEEAIWFGMGCPIRVLIVDDELPDPGRGSGYGRMFDALTMLAASSEIHVAFHGRLPPQVDSGTFTRLGIRVVDDLATHVRQVHTDYDVIVVSRPHNASAVMTMLIERFPGARVIYDAEALYAQRLARQMPLVPVERQAELSRRVEAEEREECAHVAHAHEVVCISREEADTIQTWTGAPVTVVEPWLLETKLTSATFDERRDIGFVAAWACGPESPNADGLCWFLDAVFPRVCAALPETRLYVTGDSPPPAVLEYASAAVVFTGRLPDVATLYDRIRVAIVPLRYGSGVKLKTVEAIQSGVPVVGTSEGARGLHGYGCNLVRVADDAESFASAVIELLSNHATWCEMRTALTSACWTSRAYSHGVGAWPRIIRNAAAPVRREAARYA